MRYLHNGKRLNIPDQEIEKSMKILELSKEGAIKLWLEDNGHEVNSEVEDLTNKAKSVMGTIHQASSRDKREKRNPIDREIKPDTVKEELIAFLADTLSAMEASKKVEIANKTKLIEFVFRGEQFKLDLVRKRKKKATAKK